MLMYYTNNTYPLKNKSPGEIESRASFKNIAYIYIYITIFLWRIDPIPGHGLALRGFAITLIGFTTLGMTPLDEDQPDAETSS